MDFFVFGSRVSVLVILLASAGCSTERHARAAQQTAIGGGFVAIGSLGLAGSAVSAAGVVVVAATSQASADVVLPSLLSVGVSAGVCAAITGAGFYMMSTAEPDLFVGVAPDARRPSPGKTSQGADPQDVWGRADSPRRKAERPVRLKKQDFEPRNELHLMPISERLLLGLGNDSVIINLRHMGVSRGDDCEHLTMTQGDTSAMALAYEPILGSFRRNNGGIVLKCDELLPVLKACDTVFEVTRKECKSIKSAIERDD